MKPIDEEVISGLTELVELVNDNKKSFEARELCMRISGLITGNEITCRSRIVELIHLLDAHTQLATDCKRALDAACYAKWKAF